MPRTTPAVPVDLQELRGRFEDWRRTRQGKVSIPEPLWAVAAEMARSPLMTGLHEWMEAQLADHKTEPKLRNGQSALSTQSLDQADTIPAASRGANRQQSGHCR